MHRHHTGHAGQPTRDWIQNLPAGHRSQYNSGDVIARPDSEANCVFLINSGSARICLSAEHKELTLGQLKAGSLYVTHTRAWVEALETTETTRWPIQQLTSLIADTPELALAAMREVGLILYQATNLIEDLAFRSVESRLARYLILEQQNQQSSLIQLTGHTELLASLLGTSRQTLSTLINRWIRDGLLEKPDRQSLRLLNPEQLQKMAELSAR